MYSFSLLGAKLRKKNETAKFLQPFVRVYENIFVPLPLTMNQLTRLSVWLSRLNHCRGFGIQSPTDYWMVRYVINEHWPYYQYSELGRGDNWLRRKLGRLYFRLANWRQPSVMLCDEYQKYWQTGCRTLSFADHVDRVELARVTIEDQESWHSLLTKVDEQSVIVVEGIWRNPQRWKSICMADQVMTTFDLYYCGIVLFEKKRYPKHYIINF